MADIAMLVAEEYEKIVKNSRKNADYSHVGASVGEVVALVESIKKKFGKDNLELAKSVMEPKSQIGDAAFTGLFSA